MAKQFPYLLLFVLLPLHAYSQTVQDDWTAPSAPDGSTTLQSGTRFTLLWKTNLKNSFEQWCPSCDIRKLDLWVTSFDGKDYKSKIGRGIDVNASVSYDWNVNIASVNPFPDSTRWVFRFTYFDSTDPFNQQISSPAFRISGLPKASTIINTVTAQPSSATSSSALTSTSLATFSSSATQSPTTMPDSSSSSKNNAWISGVVVGPVVGIALGAALAWFLLRKRKNKMEPGDQGHMIYGQSATIGHATGTAPKEQYYSTVTNALATPEQHAGSQVQYFAEAPDNSQREPAELWHGNYRS